MRNVGRIPASQKSTGAERRLDDAPKGGGEAGLDANPDPDPKAACDVGRYAIREDSHGCWIVTDLAAMNGGMFSSRQAAIHFIRMDCDYALPIREVDGTATLIVVANGWGQTAAGRVAG